MGCTTGNTYMIFSITYINIRTYVRYNVYGALIIMIIAHLKVVHPSIAPVWRFDDTFISMIRIIWMSIACYLFATFDLYTSDTYHSEMISSMHSPISANSQI